MPIVRRIAGGRPPVVRPPAAPAESGEASCSPDFKKGTVVIGRPDRIAAGVAPIEVVVSWHKPETTERAAAVSGGTSMGRSHRRSKGWK